MSSQPEQADASQLAEEFLALTDAAASLADFRARVEALAEDSLRRVGAKAVVFSVSGSVGNVVAVGGGYEWAYGPGLGWNSYCQFGLGFSTPGRGIALEVGFIWDLEAARDYRGLFVESAVSVPVSGGTGIVSGAVTPGDVKRFFVRRQVVEPRSLKAGAGPGSKHAVASFLLEHYWQLTTSHAERARQAAAEAAQSDAQPPEPDPEP